MTDATSPAPASGGLLPLDPVRFEDAVNAYRHAWHDLEASPSNCVRDAIRAWEATRPVPAAPGGDYDLRCMLAICYAGASLYRDDGELQDARAQPFIDFKRDNVAEISRKMGERARANLDAPLVTTAQGDVSRITKENRREGTCSHGVSWAQECDGCRDDDFDRPAAPPAPPATGASMEALRNEAVRHGADWVCAYCRAYGIGHHDCPHGAPTGADKIIRGRPVCMHCGDLGIVGGCPTCNVVALPRRADAPPLLRINLIGDVELLTCEGCGPVRSLLERARLLLLGSDSKAARELVADIDKAKGKA